MNENRDILVEMSAGGQDIMFVPSLQYNETAMQNSLGRLKSLKLYTFSGKKSEKEWNQNPTDTSMS